MCNCWIGILNSYDQSDENNLELNTYVEKLQLISQVSANSSLHKALLPKDYIDRRKGFATLFVFCPMCGARINWKRLRGNL